MTKSFNEMYDFNKCKTRYFKIPDDIKGMEARRLFWIESCDRVCAEEIYNELKLEISRLNTMIQQIRLDQGLSL